MTIVSYSEIFKLDTCQRQYYYRFILGLQPQEESSAIDMGNKGHKLLQNFYNLLGEGKTKEQALKIITENATKLLTTVHFSEVGNLWKAWTAVDNYIKATDFTSKAVIVENRYLIPAELLMSENFLDDYLLDDVQIGFTPDVVFEKQGGFYEVEDAKFVGRAWSKSKLNRFQQSKLYQIFLNRMGYKVTRSSIRFFNMTTGEIKEQKYTMSKEEEEILIRDFLNGVMDVVRFRNQDSTDLQETRRTMNYTACQFCPFEFPCTLEAEGKDASKTLANLYVKSKYDYSL